MPDKIYLNKYMLRKGMLYPAQPPADVPEKEYICKDALLAFLNERRKGLSSGDSFVAGERKMLKEIIEKIESL